MAIKEVKPKMTYKIKTLGIVTKPIIKIAQTKTINLSEEIELFDLKEGDSILIEIKKLVRKK